MSTAIIIHPDFTPDSLPPVPPAFAAFARQQEIEKAAAAIHKTVTDVYGTQGIPGPTPFHWSAEKVKHFATGGVYPPPQFIAIVGKRVSAFRKRVEQPELRLTA